VSSAPAGVDPTLPIRLPPRDAINELFSLGEIGHVRQIQEKLAVLERDDPAYARFVNQMRALVNAFDIKRYLAALEDIRSGNA
jgi:hypothetical protein